MLDEVAPGGREASRGGGEAGDAIDDDDRLPGECLGGCGFLGGRGLEIGVFQSSIWTRSG